MAAKSTKQSKPAENVETELAVANVNTPQDVRYVAIDNALGTVYSVKSILDSQVTSVAKAKSDILAESLNMIVPVDFPFPVEPDARIITLQRNLKDILSKVNALAAAYMEDECRRRVQGTDKATVTALVEQLNTAKSNYSMLRGAMPMMGIPIDDDKYPVLDDLHVRTPRTASATPTARVHSDKDSTYRMEYSIDGSVKPNYALSRAVWYATVHHDDSLNKDVAAFSTEQVTALIREQNGGQDINPKLHEFVVSLELPNGKTRVLSGKRVELTA